MVNNGSNGNRSEKMGVESRDKQARNPALGTENERADAVRD